MEVYGVIRDISWTKCRDKCNYECIFMVENMKKLDPNKCCSRRIFATIRALQQKGCCNRGFIAVEDVL
jgi:hypothetical protein